LRNSLLELEISSHETKESLGSEREKAKLEIAKLATEKETLEVTLDRRDKELKQKKEDYREETEQLRQAKEDTEKALHTKDVRIGALEAEVSLLKGKLVDLGTSVKEAEELERTSRLNTDEMSKKMTVLEKELKETRASLETAETEAQNALTKASVAAQELEVSHQECGEARKRVNNLEEACLSLQTSKSSAEERATVAEVDVDRLKAVIATKEATFDQRVEETELVKTLRRALQAANDELVDKRKVSK